MCSLVLRRVAKLSAHQAEWSVKVRMPKMGELERQDLNMLAIYCLRVAESADANSLQAEQARQLKAQWALFIGRPHPAIPGLDSEEDIEAYGKKLKQRMVSFLAGCSVSLFLAKEPATVSDSKANHATAGLEK
jgi:hypothetical protein